MGVLVSFEVGVSVGTGVKIEVGAGVEADVIAVPGWCPLVRGFLLFTNEVNSGSAHISCMEIL